jgi:NAD(P)-dependent dehydrogenase (short-subunit alcohol dehydrogenase family)
VTGASSGVGEATARLFAGEGAQVALLARRAEQLRSVADDLGASARPFVADVADSRAVTVAVRDAITAMDGVDVVVNAAGVTGEAALEDVDEQRWRRIIDTNLSGTFTVAREAGLHMREHGGGAIVNVASDLAHAGAAGLTPYCASKAGVVGLTRGLAIELAPSVRVNVICPGPIATPMMQAQLADRPDAEALLEQKRASVPLGRLADPVEVARAIRFLAVDGTFATGTSMAFDGGTSAG